LQEVVKKKKRQEDKESVICLEVGTSLCKKRGDERKNERVSHTCC